MLSLDSVAFWINVYVVLLSLGTAFSWTRGFLRLRRTRHFRHVWGIRDGDQVTVVCSELDEPERRQLIEPREFIYNLKYGDVDAFVEVLVTLWRLFPSLKLRVMSAGEAEKTRLDLETHFVVIGGPDYNVLAGRVLDWGETQFDYRSPPDKERRSRYLRMQSVKYPLETVIHDRTNGAEHCHQTDTRDYGYFERIPNRHYPKRQVIIIGGCHTIGVAGAAKAFSMAVNEHGKIPSSVLDNVALVAKTIGKADRFSVVVEVERIGQTISVPLVRECDITVPSQSGNRLQPSARWSQRDAPRPMPADTELGERSGSASGCLGRDPLGEGGVTEPAAAADKPSKRPTP
jgi:hypothetical protein